MERKRYKKIRRSRLYNFGGAQEKRKTDIRA
jgi:hypothetical protein